MNQWMTRRFLSTAALCFLLSACTQINEPETGTEWLRVSPEEVQLDAASLVTLNNRINSGDYGEIHSLLVIRHGYLAVEEYFRGYDRERKHPVYSDTKSITSLLIGIALERGNIPSVGTTLLSFFPEYPSVANPDARKSAITLADVLTMRAGFSWNEWSTTYGDTQNPTYQLATSNDWVKFMLDLPMSDQPGTRFQYNSGATVLLSGIIRNTTGKQTEAFAREQLFGPLGITDYQWDRGAQGLTNTGWGLNLRPYDMAKIGYLVLNNGSWYGQQIVASSWLETSTTKHATPSAQFNYGYQWWLLPIQNRAGHTPQANDVKFAWGYGGQFIFVVPSLDMVVVSTAGNYDNSLEDSAIDFVREYIIQTAN